MLDKNKEIRNDVYGSVSIEQTPAELQEYMFLSEGKFSVNEWRKLDIHERANILAARQINNYLEVINRYNSVVEMKRNQKENKAKQK